MKGDTEKERKKLAESISSGLAGWFQLQIAQELGNLSGEDSAQLVIAQIINAQQNFRPMASHPMAGHESSQKRVDISLVSRNGGKSEYGAVEVKWIGKTANATSARENILRDALRLAIIKSVGIKANFLVVGIVTEKINLVFSKETKNVAKTQVARSVFSDLFPTKNGPGAKKSISEIEAAYPNSLATLPNTHGYHDGSQLKLHLLSQSDTAVGNSVHATVYVWLCQQVRSKKQNL
jgi:hypothetical protein